MTQKNYIGVVDGKVVCQQGIYDSDFEAHQLANPTITFVENTFGLTEVDGYLYDAKKKTVKRDPAWTPPEPPPHPCPAATFTRWPCTSALRLPSVWALPALGKSTPPTLQKSRRLQPPSTGLKKICRSTSARSIWMARAWPRAWLCLSASKCSSQIGKPALCKPPSATTSAATAKPEHAMHTQHLMTYDMLRDAVRNGDTVAVHARGVYGAALALGAMGPYGHVGIVRRVLIDGIERVFVVEENPGGGRYTPLRHYQASMLDVYSAQMAWTVMPPALPPCTCSMAWPTTTLQTSPAWPSGARCVRWPGCLMTPCPCPPRQT